jgi:hypothetical protein
MVLPKLEHALYSDKSHFQYSGDRYRLEHTVQASPSNQVAYIQAMHITSGAEHVQMVQLAPVFAVCLTLRLTHTAGSFGVPFQTTAFERAQAPSGKGCITCKDNVFA